MNTPRMSVVMPVYNVEAYIEEAIQSVLDQTFEDFELIVVDDGGPDSSIALARTRVSTRTTTAEKVALAAPRARRYRSFFPSPFRTWTHVMCSIIRSTHPVRPWKRPSLRSFAEPM